MTDGLWYNHVSASLEDHRGGQSEIDWDLKGQSRGYDMASLQTVPCHIADIVLLEERNVSNSLLNLQDMWVKDFIYTALVCKWPLYCKLNEPHTKLMVAFFILAWVYVSIFFMRNPYREFQNCILINFVTDARRQTSPKHYAPLTFPSLGYIYLVGKLTCNSSHFFFSFFTSVLWNI